MPQRAPPRSPRAAGAPGAGHAPTGGRARRLVRQTLPEDLAGALRQRILCGELREGAALRQEAIAAEYGVSRIPVREALRLLEGEGLVELKAHRGAVVVGHSPEQLGELFDLRAMLERDLAARAVPLATDVELAHSEQVLDELERAYRRGDADAWAILNTEFHRSLYAPARRAHTLRLVESVHLLTARPIRLYHRLIAFAQAQADHRAILAHYRAGRADAAAAAVERHVLGTRDKLLAALGGSAAGARGRSPCPPRKRGR